MTSHDQPENVPQDESRLSDWSASPDPIGPYKLLEVLGEGGMGVVYLAQQTEPVRRRVALKIIKPGMDTRQVVTRFEVERQALAVMDHPNIARIYDGGATDGGRPYFVMELVLGEPITEYCDVHRLSVRDRVRLFIDVCQAVQHAHQKGVIHRDLKPTNILVANLDEKPLTKVIDFGIAKAVGYRLTEKSLHTNSALMMGTPAYMSPEQAETSGLDIDTRTDIYSLGVILYELLTGVRPFRQDELRGLKALLTLLEKEPPTPSQRFSTLRDRQRRLADLRATDPRSLERNLKGDLDWIIMKAMDKDRNRRYETANGLAMEIQRYLKDEPVLARAPSARYRAGKFLRRHRAGVATGAITALALLVSAVIATVGMVRATRAEGIASTEAATARQALDFMVDLFEVSNPSEARGNTITAREILDAGAEKVTTELAGQPVVQARLMGSIGDVYRSLGLYREAAPLLEESLSLERATYGALHEDVAARIGSLALNRFRQGEFAAAESLYDESLAIRERIFGPDHEAVAMALHGLSLVYGEQARYEEAEAANRRALGIYEKALGPDHASVATTLNNLGGVYRRLGKYDEAEGAYRRVLVIRQRTLGPDHPYVATTLSNLATLFRLQERYDEAEELYKQALKIREKVLGPDHRRVASTLNSLAALYNRQERFDEAEPLLRRSLAIKEGALGPDHVDVANSVNNLGTFYARQGKFAEAEPYLRRSLTIREKALGPDHPSVALSVYNLAYLKYDQHKYDEAEPLFLRALAIRESVLGANHPDVERTLEAYAALLRETGRAQEADVLEARAEAIRAERGR